MGLSRGRGSCARSSTVGRRSNDDTTSAERVPGGMTPCQWAKAASRMPPSHEERDMGGQGWRSRAEGKGEGGGGGGERVQEAAAGTSCGARKWPLQTPRRRHTPVPGESPGEQAGRPTRGALRKPRAIVASEEHQRVGPDIGRVQGGHDPTNKGVGFCQCIAKRAPPRLVLVCAAAVLHIGLVVRGGVHVREGHVQEKGEGGILQDKVLGGGGRRVEAGQCWRAAAPERPLGAAGSPAARLLHVRLRPRRRRTSAKSAYLPPSVVKSTGCSSTTVLPALCRTRGRCMPAGSDSSCGLGSAARPASMYGRSTFSTSREAAPLDCAAPAPPSASAPGTGVASAALRLVAGPVAGLVPGSAAGESHGVLRPWPISSEYGMPRYSSKPRAAGR
eukprot:scaffold13084_cov112-Isochrysis_galbana.AAC.6